MDFYKDLQSKKVFEYFLELCRIPHGSGNTKEISDYIKEFGEKRGLKCIQDDVNNIIIFKDASPGYEDEEPIMLQGHIDMVCEKTQDSDHDFLKDPIDVIREGDCLRADGTTLGGDDGIGAAVIMAVLDDDTIKHPPIEAVFTVDEETSMKGAHALDTSVLKAKRILNLDNEEDGVFIAGCAGGATVKGSMDLAYMKKILPSAKITITGLSGGHSGVEIDKGRANGDLVLARVLKMMLDKCEFHLVFMKGGNMPNAIPTHCEAVIAAPPEKMPVLREAFIEVSAPVKKEFTTTDPNMQMIFEEKERESLKAVDLKDTERVLRLLTMLPDGVQFMDPDIKGAVQTSLNLGVLEVENGEMDALLLLRSSSGSRLSYLKDKVISVFVSMGAEAEVLEAYPQWEYVKESNLRDRAVSVYEKLFNKEARVEITHGGLECGILSSKIPGLDAVSIGPDMWDVHTPKERLSISSTDNFWKLVTGILAYKP